ncbi:MAG: DUF368 domain-containing protein [Oenococcus sp.]|uniref:DUF368 domain-containing protein n=1 Tax=Oenococcus TaxID=46254 RepID=UPI0021E853FC|nr:DUF368 domain-containing protein [Oenococcus kitaharae]MCV3296547.1 DUF368 domain-containing protein [Oenococcus kitaharae]
MKNKSAVNPILDYLLRFFKGVFIALGFILPGVSGGVLAAILGIYERLLAFMAHPLKHFWLNVRYFLPVGIGALAGIIALANPIGWLLANYNLIVMWAFAGAILGTVPSLYKQAGQNGRGKSDWLVLTLAFIVSLAFLANMDNLFGQLPANFASWLLAGALIALGIIIPGLSPSNFLLLLGLFDPMITAFKAGSLSVFFPIAIGALLALALFSCLVAAILDHYYSKLYHAILGIVLASTLLIVLPPVADYGQLDLMQGILALVMFALGWLLGWWMGGLEEKYK